MQTDDINQHVITCIEPIDGGSIKHISTQTDELANLSKYFMVDIMMQ